ncbi:hypothetical protein TRICI_003806 [Trichomonascus ciferrii]|uniref:Uncharacterized protein n=1 Tax=Trichomonascus ciferrii TaxID=44093 RepID=A0A642V7X0_9ASCO|nr:hypothetical protein TRICI_003806 [Trichomonascus ciferrii]
MGVWGSAPKKTFCLKASFFSIDIDNILIFPEKEAKSVEGPLPQNSAMPTQVGEELYNLSCDTGTAEGGAAGEFLSFECGEAVADGGESEDNCGGQEGRDVDDAGEILDDRHDEVDTRARQVLVEHAHEVSEPVSQRTDPQQERDLNEDNQEAAYAKQSAKNRAQRSGYLQTDD